MGPARNRYKMRRSLTESVALGLMHELAHARRHLATQATHVVLVVHALDRLLHRLTKLALLSFQGSFGKGLLSRSRIQATDVSRSHKSPLRPR